jgi:hypothetical protein
MAPGSRTKTPRGKRPRGRTSSRVVAKGRTRARAPTAFERALASANEFIEAVGSPAAIIGGVAVIAWGRARSTTDIDVAFVGSPDQATSLIAKAKKFGFVPRAKDAASFAQQSLVLLLEHQPTGVALDLSFAQLAFEYEALAGSVTRQFGSVTVRVPDANALVIYKMVAARSKDIEDVEDLMVRGLLVDAERVVEALRAFDEILETDRVTQFEQLLKRVRSGISPA